MTELEQNDWPCGTKICMFYENQNICFRKKKFFGFLAIQFQVIATRVTRTDINCARCREERALSARRFRGILLKRL